MRKAARVSQELQAIIEALGTSKNHDIHAMRAEAIGLPPYPKPEDITWQSVDAGGVPAEWNIPANCEGDRIALIVAKMNREYFHAVAVFEPDALQVWHQCFAIGAPGCPEQKDNGLFRNGLTKSYRNTVRGRHRPVRRCVHVNGCSNVRDTVARHQQGE